MGKYLTGISVWCVFGLVLASLGLAQAEAAPAAPPTDYWAAIFKVVFPVVITIVGPIVTGFIKTAPSWVKYILSGLSSALVGAGAGEIPNFPLTPESAALVGLLGGPVGQALYLSTPRPPAPNPPGSSTPMSAFWLPVLLVGGLLFAGCQTYKDTTPGRALTVEKVENLSVFGTDGGFMQLVECDKTKIPGSAFYDYSQNCDPRSQWIAISSPSKGGTVFAGFLNLFGFGWLAQSNMGNSNANASSNATSNSVSSAATKGGHH